MAKKPEKLPFTVIKGALAPADGYVAKRMRERGYRIGDTLMTVLTKPRNPGTHRLAHRIGVMCNQNLPGFEELTAHQAIKRLQLESGVACDEIGAMMPNVGMTMVRIPRSISYESMDEGEFREAVLGICRHIAAQYWPGLEPEQVAEMADTMPDEM